MHSYMNDPRVLEMVPFANIIRVHYQIAYILYCVYRYGIYLLPQLTSKEENIFSTAILYFVNL